MGRDRCELSLHSHACVQSFFLCQSPPQLLLDVDHLDKFVPTEGCRIRNKGSARGSVSDNHV
jgi:hypothetical protein